MATIAERLKQAMEIRGMKQADLVSATGIGKSSISTYLTGEYEPKQKNIYKLARALTVSEAWLMGFDVPMTPRIEYSLSAHGDDYEVPADIAELVTLLAQAPEVIRKAAIAAATAVLKASIQ